MTRNHTPSPIVLCIIDMPPSHVAPNMYILHPLRGNAACARPRRVYLLPGMCNVTKLSIEMATRTLAHLGWHWVASTVVLTLRQTSWMHAHFGHYPSGAGGRIQFYSYKVKNLMWLIYSSTLIMESAGACKLDTVTTAAGLASPSQALRLKVSKLSEDEIYRTHLKTYWVL